LTKARVILADDQPTVLCEIRSLLEPTFEIVDMVTSGEALLEAVKTLHPDLVVVDISMPGMSGLEAVRRLSKSVPAPRVVFLTIHDSREMVTEAVRVGGLGYVLKASADTELALALDGQDPRDRSPRLRDRAVVLELAGREREARPP